ncbi:MAG: hypothetical protein Q4F60_02790 [Candidatus Saccharibacteria bacterium]|nr:hypothetical protein [Candidatus Saccharibacteria bacterium]
MSNYWKNGLAVIMAGVMIVSGMVIYRSEGAEAVNYCVSEKCKAAQKALSEATEAEEAANKNVDTLEEKIKQLEANIRTMEASIEANEEIKQSLAEKIVETQKVLEEQQNALAELLVEIHFEKEVDPITLLAGSNSLSDFAEKQARSDTLKEQITTSAEQVRETKESLEAKKTQVQILIEDQESQKATIETDKAEQAELKKKYEDDADGYAAAAEEAKKTMIEEMAKQTVRYNSGGIVVASGTNSYGYKARCPQDNWRYVPINYFDSWGYYLCECTSYAAFKANERWGVSVSGWGDAKYWGGGALMRGYRVDGVPAKHTVGVQTGGTWGHVVWVEAVNGDGTVDISEYNNSTSSVSGSPADFGYRSHVPVGSYYYIHFE